MRAMSLDLVSFPQFVQQLTAKSAWKPVTVAERATESNETTFFWVHHQCKQRILLIDGYSFVEPGKKIQISNFFANEKYKQNYYLDILFKKILSSEMRIHKRWQMIRLLSFFQVTYTMDGIENIGTAHSNVQFFVQFGHNLFKFLIDIWSSVEIQICFQVYYERKFSSNNHYISQWFCNSDAQATHANRISSSFECTFHCSLDAHFVRFIPRCTSKVTGWWHFPDRLRLCENPYHKGL